MDSKYFLAPRYFKYILEHDTQLMNIIPTNKIIGIEAHSKVLMPYIVYSRTNLLPVYNKDTGLYRIQITYNIFSKSYEESLDIGAALINALEFKGLRRDGIYIRNIELVSASEANVDEGVVQSIVFESDISITSE